MRKGMGLLCMLAGLAMICTAGWLLYDNERSEKMAAVESIGALESLKQQMRESTPTPEVTFTATPLPTVEPTATIEPAAEPVITEIPMPTFVPQPTATPVPTPIPDMPIQDIDGNKYIGYLEMPTIGISLPVMSEWSYPRLRKAPCRYQGNVYDDTLVILAHNYARHFGHIKDLEIGAPVQFIDAYGNIFRYQVSKHETLGRHDVDEMVNDDSDLTLFTCTYGGRSRVTVRLERVEKFD